MKRVIIISLILVVGITLLVLPLLNDDGNSTYDGKSVEFTFKHQNLAFRYGETTPIEINVVGEDVALLELVYGQQVIKSWKSPKKGKLVFNYNFSKHGTGIKGLVLKASTGNGELEIIDQISTVVFSDIIPKRRKIEIIETIAHNDTNYTQGLEFYKGELYEGTGDGDHNGSTMLGVVNLENGSFTRMKGLGSPYFGEGITILNDKVYQLTWQRGKCFVWDLKLENILHEFNYVGEGWGLCNNGKELIMSNGSQEILFRNPETFELIRKIDVVGDKDVFGQINELEYIDGKIYANVYTMNYILVIDPATGKVLEIIDASELERKARAAKTLRSGEVLNGIAFNPQTTQLYLTGKNWANYYVVKIVD